MIRDQIAKIDSEIDKINEETRPLRMKIYSADDQIRELEKRKADLIAQHADDGGGYFQMMLDGDMPLARDRIVQSEIHHLGGRSLTGADSIYSLGDYVFGLLCESPSPARLMALKILNDDTRHIPNAGQVKYAIADNKRQIRSSSPDERQSIIDRFRTWRDATVESLTSNIPGSISLGDFLEAARTLYREARVRVVDDELSPNPLAVDTLGEYRDQDESEIVELFRQAWGRGRPPENFYLDLSAGRIIQFLYYASRHDWTKADRPPTIHDTFRMAYRMSSFTSYPCQTGVGVDSIGAGLSSKPKKRRQQEDLIGHFGNCCHVCSNPHWAYIDHDHASDLVRGLACRSCNGNMAKCFHPGTGEDSWSVDCRLSRYADAPPAFSISMRDPLYGSGKTMLKNYQNRMPFMRSMAESDEHLSYILPMLDKLDSGELLTAEETLYSPGAQSAVTLSR